MSSSLQTQHAAILAHPLDLERLKEPVSYKQTECAWFFSKKNSNWELSNMAGRMPLRFAGEKWWSSEQLYQASKYPADTLCVPASSKTETDRNPNVRERIRAQKAARGAKMTQKCAVKAGLVRPDWEDPAYEVRIYSMLWVLELKLYHNRVSLDDGPSFGEVLLATGDKPIVEISGKDTFWGCKEIGGGILQGQNVLGKLLVILRQRYEEVRVKNFLYPDGFLLK